MALFGAPFFIALSRPSLHKFILFSGMQLADKNAPESKTPVHTSFDDTATPHRSLNRQYTAQQLPNTATYYRDVIKKLGITKDSSFKNDHNLLILKELFSCKITVEDIELSWIKWCFEAV